MDSCENTVPDRFRCPKCGSDYVVDFSGYTDKDGNLIKFGIGCAESDCGFNVRGDDKDDVLRRWKMGVRA